MPKKQETDSTNRPIKKYKSGAIEGCIWLNKKITNNNEEIEFKTISITRNWKKKDDDVWRSDVINLRRSDIPRVLTILNKLREDLYLEEQ